MRAGEYKKHYTNPLEAPFTQPPIGLLYVGAALENDGHKVELLDYNAENITEGKLKNSVLSSDAVGINVYTVTCSSALNISKNVKKIDPKIPLLIGGPHCIFLKQQSLFHIPHADISIVGEGENTIIDLARFMQGKKKLSDIHGIYYREKNKIKSGKSPMSIDNLDSLPFPARHLVDKYDYGEYPWGYKMKKKVTSTLTSRGCPFNCSFCSRYGNMIKGWDYRLRSAENVVKELQELDGKYRTVFILDDNFLADKKRGHKIFDMLLEMGTTLDITIHGARVDSKDKLLYKKMKKAGVKVIAYGIESGNQDVLDFYNKKVTLQQIRNAIVLARKMRFFTFGYFILGAPIETEQHIKNTIKFARSLPLDAVEFYPLYYMMGSQMWNQVLKEKKISEDEIYVMTDSSRNLGNFTKEEILEYRSMAYRQFFLRPGFLLGQIYRGLSRGDLSFLLSGLNFIKSVNNG
ncbi:MAG: B12-binding domain-containing radical SAM protein [Thermoplasmatales archaeon]|nr:MAG: B12-binding domain-containing radical SAM protein [Thermoplasmatales archaeon]